MVRNDIRIRYMYYSYGCIKKCTLSNPWYQILCSVVRPYISKVTVMLNNHSSIAFFECVCKGVINLGYTIGLLYKGIHQTTGLVWSNFHVSPLCNNIPVDSF